MTPRLLQMVFFLSVLSLLTWGVHHYLWARLVRDAAWPEPWARTATWGIVGLGVLMPLSMVMGRLLPRAVTSPIAWGVFSWMGMVLFLLMGVGLGDILRTLAMLVMGAPDPERRQFIARAMAGTVGIGALATGMWSMRTALAPWTVRNVRVRIAGLPAGLQGMSIVQLTDVHVGSTIGRDFIVSMVRAVNGLAPDLVAITGDLVDGRVSELGGHVAPLADLRAKHGVFFVTGNHEYYSGVDEWLPELRRLGVRVLSNERVAVGDGDAVIDIAGVHDWSAGRMGDAYKPDLARALAGRDVTRPVVLLAHQPKQIHEAAEHGVSLMLSGHTHGGQIWPWSKLVALDQPYVNGLHRKDTTQIYVSEGTGYWGPPMRLGTSPEITRIVLERA